MTSSTHVVLGAGQIGTLIARRLADLGEPVTLATRSGADRGIPGVGSVAVDAADPASVRAATDGATTVYFAVQPAYTDWPKGFPPLYEGVLGGLAGTGRRLVVVDNLYMYGPTGGAPIVETLRTRPPAGRAARARPWRSASSRPTARATSGSRSGGPRTSSAPARRTPSSASALLPAAPRREGRRDVRGPDLRHSYTYAPDFARALVELGRHDEAFGRAWHVPTAPAVSTRRFVEIAAGAAGVPPKMRTLGKLTVRIGGLFIPEAREMVEMAYEFEAPYVLDDSAFRGAFGLEPTPLEESLAADRRLVGGAARARGLTVDPTGRPLPDGGDVRDDEGAPRRTVERELDRDDAREVDPAEPGERDPHRPEHGERRPRADRRLETRHGHLGPAPPRVDEHDAERPRRTRVEGRVGLVGGHRDREGDRVVPACPPAASTGRGGAPRRAAPTRPGARARPAPA